MPKFTDVETTTLTATELTATEVETPGLKAGPTGLSWRLVHTESSGEVRVVASAAGEVPGSANHLAYTSTPALVYNASKPAWLIGGADGHALISDADAELWRSIILGSFGVGDVIYGIAGDGNNLFIGVAGVAAGPDYAFRYDSSSGAYGIFAGLLAISGTTKFELVVSCFGSNSFIVAAKSGVIRYTLNSGSTWLSQSGPIPSAISVMASDNNNTAVIVDGSNGDYAVTTNGGASWTLYSADPALVGVSAIQYIGNGEWLAATSSTSQTKIARTTDLTNPWTQTFLLGTSNPGGSTTGSGLVENPRIISIATDQRGTIVAAWAQSAGTFSFSGGKSGVLVSHDRGRTWRVTPLGGPLSSGIGGIGTVNSVAYGNGLFVATVTAISPTPSLFANYRVYVSGQSGADIDHIIMQS